MIRLLLSLLALVSGLAVQGEPAWAMACGPDIELNTPAPARVAAQTATRVTTFAVVHGVPAALAIDIVPRFPTAQFSAVPGVLIGIDRAHE